MDAFLVSTGFVALAEMGDKTQLLAMILAARFKRPWPIVLGILVATLLNHALAGLVGTLIGKYLSPDILRWILVVGFIGMAIWMLIPDKVDDDDTPSVSKYGVFATTTIAFFIAEMGDKTQVATIAMAAKYSNMFAVVAGTTLGMMIANAPAVWLGDKFAHKLPVKIIHSVAAGVCVILALLAAFNIGELF